MNQDISTLFTRSPKLAIFGPGDTKRLLEAAQMVSMIQRLFVYGTLGPGRPNEHILRNIGGSWERASVIGRLHHEGWGAAMGYPGITLDEDGERVRGYLFSSDKIAEHWAELDAFEGDAYERVTTTVERLNNSVVEAYIYALKL